MDIRQEAIRIERVFALLLFAGLIGFFVYRVSGVAEVAERMSVETHIRQLQAAIDMEFANLMMLNQQKKALNWLGKNPFPMLKAASESENIFSDYLGEQWDVQLNNIERGKWIYDKNQKVIIYRLKNDGVVTSNDPIKGRMVWKVIPRVIEENDLIHSGKHKRVDSVRLKSLYEYKWNY